MLHMEEWRSIRGFKDYYVSNLGRILSKNNKVRASDKILKPTFNKKRGYFWVMLHGVGRRRNLSLHRLVAQAFTPNPDNKPVVNHIDNDTTNNKASNLEWVTQQENVAHCIKSGRQVILYGSEAKAAKLTETQVMEIYNMKGIDTYESIAEQYGVKYSTVAHIMRGSRWQHLTQSKIPS